MRLKRPLLEFTSKGIYCSKGNFYIDPWSPVPRAIVTHAHGDHAYRGHRLYLAQQDSVPILHYRWGQNVPIQGLPYREPLTLNGKEKIGVLNP